MNITIRPLGRGRFAASVGQRLMCESKTPFFTTARILLREGVADDTVISMTHERSSAIAMMCTVGEAAGRVVEETDQKGPRFKPYRPMAFSMSQQGVREQSNTAISEAEVRRTKDEPEQPCLWDLLGLTKFLNEGGGAGQREP